MDSDEDDGYPQFVNKATKPVEEKKETSLNKIPPSYSQSRTAVIEQTSITERYEKKYDNGHYSKTVSIQKKQTLLKKRLPQKISPNIKVPRPSKLKKRNKKRTSSKPISRRSPKKLPVKPIIMEKKYEFSVPKTRHALVYEILKRWWYCMPEWPPVGEDYSKKLEEQNMRELSVEEFRISEEVNSEGRRKVQPIPGYQGLFRNSDV